MDKKIDELNRINLKVSDDAEHSLMPDAERQAPNLVTATSSESVDAPNSVTAPSSEPIAEAPMSSSNPDQRGNDATQNNPMKPTFSPGSDIPHFSSTGVLASRFSNSTVRKAFALVACAAIAVGVNNGLKSVWNSPMSSWLGTIETPSIFAAWCGDPDAANAVQGVPLAVEQLMSDLDNNHKDVFSIERKQAVLKNLERFTKGAPPQQRQLSSLMLAYVFADTGRAQEASNIFQSLKTENPLLSGFHGMTLTMADDYAGALAECNRGIDLARSSRGLLSATATESLWTLKSQILLAMGRFDEALKTMEFPDYPESWKHSPSAAIHVSKAGLYLKMGLPDKAIVEACQAPTLNHMLLSTAYLMKGDIPEATTHAGKSYLAQSRIYSQTGQLADALKFAKLADDAKLGVGAREQHVYVLNQLGRYREAIALGLTYSSVVDVRHIMDGMQAMPELRADLAWAYAKSGDAKNALEQARLALNTDPSCRQALEAAKLASQISGDLVGAEQFDRRLKKLNPRLFDRPIFYFSENQNRR